MKIGNKSIGKRTYIIAEFGVNHNGSLARAKEGIRKAAKAGADAIKFQTYKASDLVVKGTPKFWDAESKVDEGLNQYEAYEMLEGFKDEWYPILIDYCEEHGIEFLSTPFSKEAADMLDAIGMKAFKVASSDMSTIPYLQHIAQYKKPILLSTGAATLQEIKQSVRAIEEAGNDQIAILHCTLSYPTKDEDANLEVIRTLTKEFPFHDIGLSDHTLGAFPAALSCAFGATIIEKHFTVNKSLDKSADHWLSVDPKELKEIVDTVRRIEVLKGIPEKLVLTAEKETRMYDKRSIVAAEDIPRGAIVTREMLTFKRPGTGLWPEKAHKLVGRRASKNIKADTILEWNHFRKN
jgi:N,N'-diacetyllegionaminate synthase